MVEEKININTDLNIYKKYLKPEKDYLLKITLWKKTKTHKQLKMIHGLIKELSYKIASDQGLLGNTDFEYFKLGVKEQAMNERGYPYVTDGNNIYPLSLAHATTEQAGIIIETLFDIAAELGLNVKTDWIQWQEFKNESIKEVKNDM